MLCGSGSWDGLRKYLLLLKQNRVRGMEAFTAECQNAGRSPWCTWVWWRWEVCLCFGERIRIWFCCLGVRNILVRGLQFGFGLGCLGWEKHLSEFEKYMGIYLVWLSGGADNLDRWCVALAVAHWGVLCLGWWHSVEVEVSIRGLLELHLTLWYSVLDRVGRCLNRFVYVAEDSLNGNMGILFTIYYFENLVWSWVVLVWEIFWWEDYNLVLVWVVLAERNIRKYMGILFLEVG